MPLFCISGSKDWGVTDIGEKLCHTFKEDTATRKKGKTKGKNKNIKGNKAINQIGDKINNVMNETIKSHKVSKLLNKKEVILNGIKKTMLKSPSSEEVPLNKSFYPGEHCSPINKKGLKRKRSASTLPNESVKRPKKDLSDLKELQNKKRTSKELKPKDNMPKKNKELKPKNTQQNHIEEKQNNTSHNSKVTKSKKKLQKLKQLLEEKSKQTLSMPKTNKALDESNLTLRQRMMRKLKAARFRYLNEQIYSTTGKETAKAFRRDPEAFKAYHEGYKLQVKQWPVNPLDKIIASICKLKKDLVVADFGCGEGKLAKSVKQKVHSFDLVAANEDVIACDMAHVPLADCSVDIAVFCLSLMGTNLGDYLLEANRVLKKGGVLKIAEVESRFDDVNDFVKNCERYGFKKTWLDCSYNLFYFIDFKKKANVGDKKSLPKVSLQPCLYKKR